MARNDGSAYDAARREAVSSHDFSDAFAVAADAAEETTPEEPREEVTP